MYLKTILILTIITLTTSISFRNHKSQEKFNYFINLSADNWIFGGEINDINQARFVSVIQHSVSHQCPPRKPYTTDGKQCFQCPTEYPIFNLFAKECQRCPKTNSVKNHECKA